MSSSYTLVDVQHMDPTYPLFPILCAFGVVFTLLPAYWHIKSGNVGTIAFMVWTFLGCSIYGLNSVIWAGNLKERPWFWCDLTTKIIVGMSVGLPTASLVINRRLYLISTIRQVQVSKSEARRNMWIELAIAVGGPVLLMVVHVVSQGHRFDVYENVGCWPSLYVTPMAVATIMIWPIVIGLVSCVYATLSIRAFLKQRKQFSNILQSTSSGLSINRYFRLMALASTEILFALPYATYMLIHNVLAGMSPWISWADTHLDFNRVNYVPFGLLYKIWPDVWIIVNVSRYILPVQGFFLFIYLGMSGESGVFYRKQFWRVAGLVGIKKPMRDPTASAASWVARPGASAGASSHLHSLPPYATTTSFAASVTEKKELDDSEIYQISTSPGGAKGESSSSSSGSSDVGTDDDVSVTPGDLESGRR